jgi:hypothetical protein
MLSILRRLVADDVAATTVAVGAFSVLGQKVMNMLAPIMLP